MALNTTSSVARRLLQACRTRPLPQANRTRPLRRPLRWTRAATVLAAAASVTAFGLVGVLGAAAAAAALSPAPAAAPAPAAGVQTLTASPADRVALTEAYASARHVPGSAVAGIRPGSLHLARVTATGVTWAVAGFTPSPAAGLRAQVAFQDSAASGVFSRTAGQSWRLVQPAAAPGTCESALPAAVRAAWHLAEPAGCGTTMAAQKSAASRARSAAGRAGTVTQSIASIALGQVGIGDTPAARNFSGVDCDPYTTLVGSVTPNSDGCGYDPAFKVENENEEWCSDFAQWVWEQAGVTANMSAINAGSDSFYDWGLDQGETMPIDSTFPQAGDAVVFFPPGSTTPATYADHVGIVTAVNADGTVNLVNGDFLGTSNTTVQYDTDITLKTWASEVWSRGEQWVFVAPPGTAQQAAPHASIAGPPVTVAGTAANFAVTASEAGGSISQYQWTFGDGATSTGRTAAATGRTTSHVFANAGLQTVTMTATSSFGTVTTGTWNVDVVSASSAVTTTPSHSVYYSTVPVDQNLFLRTADGGLAEESWDGVSWLRQDLPGTPTRGGGLTALNYADASGVLEAHVFFRTAAGQLAQTTESGGTWASATLPGNPARGSTIVATTTADAPALPTAEVFYLNQAGQPAETYQQGGTWASQTLPGPVTGQNALALANTSQGASVCTHLYYLSPQGALTGTSAGGCGPALPLVLPGTIAAGTSTAAGTSPAAGTSLAALGAGTGGRQQEVFFTDRLGHLAEAATGPAGIGWPTGIGWQVRELPGTPSGTLLAQNYLPSSGAPNPEVFYRAASGRPTVTYASGQTGNSGQAGDSGQAWNSGTLPGTATGLLGAAAYPATQPTAPAGSQPASQSDRLFLANGSGVTADTAAVPAGPWTAATLPATAATFADRVVLYAATRADDQSALVAAWAAGLPATHVTQSFGTAWADALTGDYLVIAVGQTATDGLYFNACGWVNPSGAIPDSTPFHIAGAPLHSLPGADAYEEAAAATTSQTPSLATDLAYYAVHRTLPAGVTALPTAAAPRSTCTGSPS